MTEPMAYIGRKVCGCVVFAVVDEPGHERETAKDVAKVIRQGLTIERVTCDAVRKGKFGCDHKEVR